MAKENILLNQKLKVLNIGIKPFYDTLKEQNIEVVQINWRPPAGGDDSLIKLLEKIGARPRRGN